MQPGKRQMRLRLHACSREHRHPALARRLRGDGQQPRLADPRLTAEHQRLTAVSDPVEDRRQEALFLGAPEQRRSLVTSGAEHARAILPSLCELVTPIGIGKSQCEARTIHLRLQGRALTPAGLR